LLLLLLLLNIIITGETFIKWNIIITLSTTAVARRTLAFSPYLEYASWHHQGHAGSKTS